ncbi:MAG: DUF2752 domain-containing protein [Planctomycetaceae bacterium]|nr:DUF2752 domain-containing protein [Planctomycetaceae bacterium]
MTTVSASAGAAPAARRGDAPLHWVLGGLALAVLALALLLETEEGTRVVAPWLGVRLPELCYARRWLGLNCPGCGMTRSFIAIMHGEFTAAWRYNPAGFLVWGVVAFQVPYRSLQLWRLRRGLPELNPTWLVWSWALVGAALLIQWVARLS